MTWAEFLTTLVAAVFKGARSVRKANQADHAAAVEQKADIDRRHVPNEKSKYGGR